MLRLLLWGATLLLATGLGLYLTPIVRRGAIRFGVLDHPDGRLKQQAEPIPYLGGVAVYLAFLITLGLVFDFEARLLGLLLGGTMVAMLGLFDDLRVLTPRLKLGGQLLAALTLLKAGIAIQLVAMPVWVSVPLTIVWIAGVTNAVNIIDVSDGLSAGVACIAGVALFLVAALHGDTLISVTTLALVGSLMGFLRYNQPPARIYLGDTGALFVGFMLAALSMIGTYTRHSPVGALAPVLILWVPILDTVLVTLARLARRQSPLRGSPDHFAVRLKRRGWSAQGVAAYGYALGAVGGGLGVAITLVPPPLAYALTATAVLLGGGTVAWWWSLGAAAPAATLQSVSSQ